MPTLSIDSYTRLQILQAIRESTEGYRIIALPDGAWLLMMSHCGNVAFDLLSVSDDLFDARVDVSALVLEALEGNCSS